MKRANDLLAEIDCAEVERVAVDASTCLDEQTDAALDELERQLRALGHLS